MKIRKIVNFEVFTPQFQTDYIHVSILCIQTGIWHLR